jgi:hypothetical protein
MEAAASKNSCSPWHTVNVRFKTSLKPIGCTWSCLACRTGHSVPVWQSIQRFLISEMTDAAPMERCTAALEKGLMVGCGCGAAFAPAPAALSGATVAAVCPSITLLQLSPSTAAIMFSLRGKTEPNSLGVPASDGDGHADAHRSTRRRTDRPATPCICLSVSLSVCLSVKYWRRHASDVWPCVRRRPGGQTGGPTVGRTDGIASHLRCRESGASPSTPSLRFSPIALRSLSFFSS